MQMNVPAARFDAEITVDPATGSLLVHYVVESRAETDLFLFNKLYDWFDEAGHYRVSVDRVAIEVHDDRVVVSKKLVPVPDWLDVESPNLPCITVLAPGGRFAETLRAPLPLTPWTPYEDALPGTTRPLPVWFELGWFVGGVGARDLARTVATSIGPALRFSAFTESQQQLFRVGPFAAAPTSVP